MRYRWDVWHQEPESPGCVPLPVLRTFESESDRVVVEGGITIFPASVHGIVLIVPTDRLYSATATLVGHK